MMINMPPFMPPILPHGSVKAQGQVTKGCASGLSGGGLGGYFFCFLGGAGSQRCSLL